MKTEQNSEALGGENGAESQANEAASRKRYRDYVRERYADRVPESEDGWPELEDLYAEESENMLGRYKESENMMQEAITMYPELGAMILDITINKIPLSVALAKHFSIDDIKPMEGDEDYSEYQKAYDERKSRLEARTKLEAEFLANQEQTIKDIDAYAEKKGYSEEEKNALLDFIETSFSNMMMKKLTPKMIEDYDRAMHYEDDIKSAEEIATINAKNEKIAASASEAIPGDNIPLPKVGSQKPEKEENKFFKGVGERKRI